jgi:predicted GNAT family acetyltransferase
LLPARFCARHAPQVRLLGPGDTSQVDELRAHCGQEAWQYAGLDEASQHLAAAFEDERIVAMAGYRPWSDEAGDPCILTHPDRRGQGLATKVTSAVVSAALREGKLLLYQTLEANTAAVKVAFKLGYERYGQHVAVRLRAAAPP